MSQIMTILAREILDSRGYPTVEAEVILSSGARGRAAVPSGASTGSREALELRDQDSRYYLGKGVRQAVRFIQEQIAPALKGMSSIAQEEIDALMISLDGTENKEKFGANSLLAVSLATAKAAAADRKQPFYCYLAEQAKIASNEYTLPVPMMNIINGGAHADNNLDFQEFMILPVGAPSFKEALRAGAEIFQHLKQLLKAKSYNTNVGDEGGFAPDLPHQEAALDFIMQAILRAGYQPQQHIYLGLDIASNELYRDDQYFLASENRYLSAAEFIDYLSKLTKAYPIISIEDAMAEHDWKGWSLLSLGLGQQIQLVGDDLFVTNTTLLQKGIQTNIANAILIKPNQIGTLTETLAAISMAKNANYNTIISHRSGETEDTSIADIAVGTKAGQIKTGSLSRSDRVAKYNQLLRIEEELGNNGRYAGQAVFSQFSNVTSMKELS